MNLLFDIPNGMSIDGVVLNGYRTISNNGVVLTVVELCTNSGEVLHIASANDEFLKDICITDNIRIFKYTTSVYLDMSMLGTELVRRIPNNIPLSLYDTINKDLCPCCGSVLWVKNFNNTSFRVCTNSGCLAQCFNKITHILKVLNVQINSNILMLIQLLIGYGYINKFLDLFNLDFTMASTMDLTPFNLSKQDIDEFKENLRLAIVNASDLYILYCLDIKEFSDINDYSNVLNTYKQLKNLVDDISLYTSSNDSRYIKCKPHQQELCHYFSQSSNDNYMLLKTLYDIRNKCV